jgi:hypothetical protein
MITVPQVVLSIFNMVLKPTQNEKIQNIYQSESHTLWCPYTKLVKIPKRKKLYIFLVHIFNQSYVNFKCINL